MSKDELAAALRDTLISPNVANGNWEAANIVDVIDRLSRAINKLGNDDAAIQMVGKEGLVKAILDASEKISMAITDLAEAIRGHEPMGDRLL